jgi:hypothetical protein
VQAADEIECSRDAWRQSGIRHQALRPVTTAFDLTAHFLVDRSNSLQRIEVVYNMALYFRS